jgi:hypothetical protein
VIITRSSEPSITKTNAAKWRMGPTRGRNGGFRPMRRIAHILVGRVFLGVTWQASPLRFSNISISSPHGRILFDMFMAEI